jgi:hypothetical protein
MEKDIYIFDSKHGPIYIEKPRQRQPGSKTPTAKDGTSKTIKVKQSFEDAMGNVEALYKSLGDVVQKIAPDSFDIEVGVKFNVSTGFFVLTAGTDIEFKVSLKWNGDTKKVTTNTIENPSS